MPKYDGLIIIDPFQPFTIKHKGLIEKCIEHAERVLVFCEYIPQAPSINSPFDTKEVVKVINNTFNTEKSLSVVTLSLQLYAQSEWEGLNQAIQRHFSDDASLGLVNREDIGLHKIFHKKIEHVKYSNYLDIRLENKKLFQANTTDIRDAAPSHMFKIIHKWQQSDGYKLLEEEYRYVKRYKEQWIAAPYPPTFVTVDALVTRADKVLMVQRKNPPGQGNLALPGGFVNTKESLRQACIRELQEETQIKVSEAELDNSIINTMLLDFPYRDPRGRVVSHLFHFDLLRGRVPKVSGADDAYNAVWKDFNTLNPTQVFADHYPAIVRLMQV